MRISTSSSSSSPHSTITNLNQIYVVFSFSFWYSSRIIFITIWNHRRRTVLRSVPRGSLMGIPTRFLPFFLWNMMQLKKSVKIKNEFREWWWTRRRKNTLNMLYFMLSFFRIIYCLNINLEITLILCHN